MEYADSQVITTGVDRLIEFLKGKGQIELSKVAKRLQMPSDTIQNWVDFLVEEKIVGIEYKFTTPYIYLIDKHVKNSKQKSFAELKAAFKTNTRESKINDSKSEFLWQNQVTNTLEGKKDFFIKEAEKRKLQNIETLWENYKAKAI